MSNGTFRSFAALLALALMCPLGGCATSDNINANTGGSNGSGGGSSGGSTGSGGGASGGSTGSGGNGSGGSTGSGGSNPSTGGMSGADSGAGASPYANFATIQQIVQLKCGGASCHNSGLQDPMFQADSNLYKNLTTLKAPDCMNYTLVKAGNPNQSAMYLAISGICGGGVPQMPDGCTGGDPSGPDYSCLPPDYIEGVRQWIANGAPQQ
jgi:hypothetical protein